MISLKTYPDVIATQKDVNVSVVRMEDVHARRKGWTDEPHRHNFYTVLVIKSAKGLHKIDFNEYALANNQVYFIAPGQIHQILEEEQSFGIAMTFSVAFLIENAIPISFIDGLNLFENYGQSPPLTPNAEQFKSIFDYADEMNNLFCGASAFKKESIGAYLKLLLIACNNICSLHPFSKIHSPENTSLQSFKDEVEKAFQSQHSTTYYATQLHFSPDHLNRIVKAGIGSTAKEYIQARIITEAKRLLYFSDLSTKEIGYKLGFEVPANFSAFFKKCTKISPSSFKSREKSENLLEVGFS